MATLYLGGKPSVIRGREKNIKKTGRNITESYVGPKV